MAFEIHIVGSEQHFPCAEGEAVLDAALRAGLQLPYACRKGVCGSCAGAVVTGQVRNEPSTAVDPPPPGQVLFCRCMPLSDLQIAPRAWALASKDARQRLLVKVFRNLRVAENVSVLHLRLPAGRRARFKAGQYLQVLLPDGSRRSYSMANAPHDSDMLQLHIRHLPGGQFTQLVPQLAVGDTLEVELPFGRFLLHDTELQPLLCVAGGTGLAPIQSLLDDGVRRSIRRPVTLVRGARNASGLYLRDSVARWQAALPGFRLIEAVEDAAEARELGVFHGRVDTAIAAHTQSLDGCDVYACGAPAMVAAVRAVCVDALGLAPDRFYSDVFVPGPAVA
jgi:CDP-4-dehydro-6-deoxyglucose reductase/terephthalate 1,2-dioxygenase reductase component